ncbi:MAG: oxidoreductase, partial [Planctomycetaceae bacterium]
DLAQRLTGRDNILVIDELSAPLPALSALLFLLTILSTLRTKLDRFSMSLTLFSESIVLATLSCHDPWLLIVLLSLAVVPPWIELVRRGVSPRVFLIHMGASIVLLVAGRMLLGDVSSGGQASGLSAALLTAAALLRAGVIPVHCWMADLLEKATFGTAILFLTPMTGAFAVMH